MPKKLDNAIFTERVRELVKDEYTFLEKYINAKTKIKVQHQICKDIYEVTPNSFLNGARCPKCKGGVVLTTEDFKHKVNEITNGEYEVLGDYTNSSTPIELRHLKCQTRFSMSPHMFLKKKNKCPNCKKDIERVSNDKFLKKVFDLVGEEYTFLEEYKGFYEHITVRHNICGDIYEVRPDMFYRGRRCKKCFHDSITKTHKEYIHELEIQGLLKEYKILSKYVTSKDKVEVEHLKCNYIYEVYPLTLTRGHGCPKCANNLLKDSETFKKEVFELEGEEYEVIGEYIDSKTKIKMKHKICNNIFEINPTKFISGTKCLNCRASKGEKKILKFLIEKHIKYSQEFVFQDMETNMRFDFAIKENDKVICLIEYDGIQHFEPIEFWGGVGALEDTKRRDEIKNKYCKENNIPLIRIPYWEQENIADILATELTKIGIIKDR